MDAPFFRYFISFSFTDDKTAMKEHSGRVTTFREKLLLRFETRTGRKRGKDFADYYCKAEHRTGDIHTVLKEEATAAHVLIPMLSPSYLASQYCADELASFIQGRSDQDVKKDQIKKLVIPIEWEECGDKPLGELQGAIAERLWERKPSGHYSVIHAVHAGLSSEEMGKLDQCIERIADALKRVAEPLWGEKPIAPLPGRASLATQLFSTKIPDAIFVDAVPCDAEVAHQAAKSMKRQGFDNVFTLADARRDLAATIDFDSLARQTQSYLIVCEKAAGNPVKQRVRQASRVKTAAGHAAAPIILVDATKHNAYRGVADEVDAMHVSGFANFDEAASSIRNQYKARRQHK